LRTVSHDSPVIDKGYRIEEVKTGLRIEDEVKIGL
jgi:hypothetical protein